VYRDYYLPFIENDKYRQSYLNMTSPHTFAQLFVAKLEEEAIQLLRKGEVDEFDNLHMIILEYNKEMQNIASDTLILFDLLLYSILV
jgi:hypothetical protein